MNKGIDVEIIKDSTNWTGKRLTTFILKYPRYIHAELMTHRVFSKNSASSRAIPINKMITNIEEDMVTPIWTINQKGMQGVRFPEDTPENQIRKMSLDSLWRLAFGELTRFAVWPMMEDFNIHKQNVNRLLEPWMHIKIILTGTDFENWFTLRDHPDAQPEIQLLAKKMKLAMEESKPTYLNPGEWHIPFDNKYTDEELRFLASDVNFWWSRWDQGGKIDKAESVDKLTQDFKLRVSVANCARTSYNNVDGSQGDLEKDLELFRKLLVSEPLHASPAEHQAKVPYPSDYLKGHMSVKHSVSFPIEEYDTQTDSNDYWGDLVDKRQVDHPELVQVITLKGKYFSNLQGWIQYRKILEEEKYKK